MEEQNSQSFTVKDMLIRLEIKVDKVIEDHESRIRLLEKIKYGIPASLLTSIGSFVTALVIAKR